MHLYIMVAAGFFGRGGFHFLDVLSAPYTPLDLKVRLPEDLVPAATHLPGLQASTHLPGVHKSYRQVINTMKYVKNHIHLLFSQYFYYRRPFPTF